jgi:hypothetical protein
VYVKAAVSLINTTSGNVISFGDSYLINSSKFTFTKYDDKQYLGWFDSEGNPITEIIAPRGVYSAQAYLRPVNTTFTFEGVISI